MQSAEVDHVDYPELTSMIATLCCYEERFGPYHPVTLRLTIDVAVQLKLQGRIEPARGLLERTVRDVQRFLGRTHEVRLRGITELRNLMVEQNHAVAACCLQREFLECQVERLGPRHPETLAARTDLEKLLLDDLTASVTDRREFPT